MFVIRKVSPVEDEGNLSYRIITSPAEGVATQNATYSQKHAAQNTVALYRLKSIIGTCGFEPTTGRKQGRDKVLVHPDQTNEEILW